MRLADQGATVAVNYRENAVQANALITELSSKSCKAMAFQANVSKPENCHALVDAVIKAYGRLDILVSNAGVDSFDKLEELTEEEYLRVFSINVGVSFLSPSLQRAIFLSVAASC